MSLLLIKQRKIYSKPTGDVAFIRVGRGKVAMIDAEDYIRFSRYYWKLQKSNSCYYAVRKVSRGTKTLYIRMHREVVNCPKGYHVHHKNHNTLDNRKCNLEIVKPSKHAEYHSNRVFLS